MSDAAAFQDEVWGALPEGGQPWERNLRERFVLARVRPGDRILDLGCGEGWACGALRTTGARPVGADISAVALERAARHYPEIAFQRLVPEEPLPFGDASFDVVWVSEVLAHVAHPGPLIAEVRRVLRPGGLLLTTTGHHGRLRRVLHHGDPPLRHDTRRSLRALLHGAGFDDVTVSAAGGLPLARRLLLAEARRP